MRLKPHVKLWTHQREEADHIKANEKTLLLAGCGVGKTLTVLAAIAEQGFRRVLVLTVKAAMHSVWEEEIEAFTEGATVLVLDKGNADQKDALLQQTFVKAGDETLIVVVNYETAQLLRLDQYDWDMAVADESHKLKSYNSAQSNTLARLTMYVPKKVAMTGTAWEDRPTDVYGQVRWLEPMHIPRGKYLGSARFGSWTRFFEEYVVYKTRDNIKIPISYKNQEQLAEKISDLFRFVDRDKVLDLPPVQHAVRDVYLSDKHYKVYKELRDEMYAEIGKDEITADNQLELMLRLHQITGGFYQPEGSKDVQEIKDGTAKLDMLMSVLDEIGENEPVVVFTRFKEDVSRISEALKKQKISYRVLVGGKDQHREWKAGKGRILIANIQAGSAGINLTRAAYAVFYSTGYSATDYIQALARIDRPGQKRKVTFYHIIAKGTVDVEIRDLLKSKEKNSKKLLKLAKEG